jgi:Ran GTPase-activating protein (RanGAP) involved in mRNA processing and transport
LESLDLSGNSYNDDEIQCLSTALASNSRLRELQLSWEAVATVLRNPNSALERLDLNSNTIDDRTILSFTDALAVNNKLRQLSMARLRDYVTNKLRDEDDLGAPSAGWQSFSNVLQAPTSVLEQLDLSDNRIDDNVLATLANALANNTMLKEMKLCSLKHDVTITGWQTFTTVLRSNTLALEKLDLSGNVMPNRLLSFIVEALANNNTLIELKFGAYGERSSTIDYQHIQLQSYTCESYS